MKAEMLCRRCADAIRHKDPSEIFPLGTCAQAFAPDSPIIVKGGSAIIEAGELLCDGCNKLIGLSDLVACHLFDVEPKQHN